MKRLLLLLGAIVMLATGCATAVSERLSVYPIAGQPRSRVVLDRAECEQGAAVYSDPRARDPRGYVPQWYAACMVSRGYISEVTILVIDRMGGREYRPFPNYGMSFFLRADRPVAEETAKQDIAACEQAMTDTVRSASVTSKVVRDVVAHWTFGTANIGETKYRRTFNECMSARGYGVSADHDELQR